jgi:SpoVK/Ycf46/Vps4 family AAA+-type ATPase
MKIIHPLQHPDIYKAYGKKIGGGILMYGPPGCGKTHLARATAGQVNSNFIPVGISDILDMYIGQSERNLHSIFQKARSRKPAVLFFDEVDALGASRSDMRHSAGRNVINQFLSELDGIEYDNEGVLILAATNAPWHLDPAFRRPGRFDRIIFVPPPDEAARAIILQIKLKGKPISDINFDKLAKKTAGFSGADLEAVVDIAIESKLEEAMKKGVPQPIETKDLEKAIKAHRSTTKEWFSTAKNYALFANEAGIYDDILDYLNIKK